MVKAAFYKANRAGEKKKGKKLLKTKQIVKHWKSQALLDGQQAVWTHDKLQL